MANYYDILDIDSDVDQATIKAAYRKLAKRYHPDITGDVKGHFFVMIQDAYDCLSDEKKRTAYDRTLSSGSSYSSSSSYQDDEQEQKRQEDEEFRRQYPEPPKNWGRTENTPSEIPYPVVNWNAMEWFKKDYSQFKERIALPHPGKTKGLAGGAVFLGLSVFLAMFSMLFPIPNLPPLPFAAIFAGIGIKKWIDYVRFRSTVKPYLAFMGAFVVLFGYSILFGGQSGAPVPLGLAAIVASAGAIYLGYWSALRWHHWERVRDSRYHIAITAKDIKDYVSWGKPGQLDDAVGKFSAHNVALGIAGEKFTAELMEQLLKIPGTRIFHGLKFPGSETADVDHAIINGNKIALVDSKMWSGGDYRWGRDGIILRSNSSTSAELQTNFHHAVVGYGRELREAQIRGRILIHSSNGRPVTVDNTNAERTKEAWMPDTEMATAQQFFDEIGEWFSEGNPGYINRGLMNALMMRVK